MDSVLVKSVTILEKEVLEVPVEKFEVIDDEIVAPVEVKVSQAQPLVDIMTMPKTPGPMAGSGAPYNKDCETLRLDEILYEGEQGGVLDQSVGEAEGVILGKSFYGQGAVSILGGLNITN